MSPAVMLRVGARFTFDGEVVEVVQVEGTRLTVRDAQDRWRTVSLAAFVARAVAMVPDDAPPTVEGAGLAATEDRIRKRCDDPIQL